MRQVVKNVYWTVSVSLKCVLIARKHWNLTEKQNGYLESGCLKEAVTYERCGRYESVECRSKERM